MALKSCSYCGHTISTLAFACPGCGAPGEAAGRARTEAVTAAPDPAATPGEAAGTARTEAVSPAPTSAGTRGPLPPLLMADQGAAGSAPTTRTSKALLLLAALAMALLGAIADSAVHRSAARPLSGVGTATEATDTAELQREIAAGLQGRSPEAVIDTVRAYQAGARELHALTAMRLTLADVSTHQEMFYAERAAYATDLDTLGVIPRPGVRVTLTASPTSWSAAASHDQLPGVTCSTGMGGDQAHPGQITCPGEDTLHGRLP